MSIMYKKKEYVSQTTFKNVMHYKPVSCIYVLWASCETTWSRGSETNIMSDQTPNWVITCACVACNKMLDKPWAPGVSHTKQLLYKPVVDCTYWTGLGYFNNQNITQLKNKTTSSEDFDEIHKFSLMASATIWHHWRRQVNMVI